MPDDPHMEKIVNNAKAYVGANFQQFSLQGSESVALLVKMKESYFQQLESNTHNIYLNLKLHYILVQHYCFVMVKLDKTHIQEEAEANTAAKMRTDNHAASSSHNTYVPWWRKKYQCSGYDHGKKNQLKNKSKKDDRKGKGKDEAAQHIKKYTGWDCDHNNCDSNMETPDPVPALCTCHEWGNCSEAACPLGKGSWTPPALETVEYQDGILGHYGGNWQSKVGSSHHGHY